MPTRFAAVLAVLATMLASPPAAERAQAQRDDTIVRDGLGARVDSFLTRASAFGLSGAIVVAQRGEVVLRKGYGLADRERGAPIVAETPFFLGSLAKQFTAAAVLRLEADGKLSVGDSLGRFFPDAPADKQGITLRQLLTHTSGLPYLPSAGLFGRGTRDSVMREMLSEPLEFAPGTRTEYSTPGYILLAGVIERASGVSYEDYLRTGLFARAGLRSTGFVGERARWSLSHVRSYSDATSESWLADVPALPRFVGAGSIVATVGDLHRWYLALTRGEVLPDSARDALFAPVTTLRPGLQQAYDWMLVRLPTGMLRQVAGDIGGFNAELRHYVDEELIVAFASNARVRGRGYREIVMNYVARMSRGEVVPLPPEIALRPGWDVQRLAGSYALDGGGRIAISIDGDSLTLGALDASGLAALAGHDSATRARSAEVDARASLFLAALTTGRGADGFVHASIPADARREFLDDVRLALADSDSAPSTLLGTAIDSPAGSRSYVQVHRPRGDAVFALLWRGGALVGLEPSGQAAYRLRLHPEGADTLTAFDLFTGHLVRVIHLANGGLAVESNGVRRPARRE